MDSVAYPEHAWELYQAGKAVEEIAEKLEVHRATLFRWFKGIRLYGIREFLRRYKVAKRRKRAKQLDPRIEPLLVERRREKGHCGQKLRHWLKKVHGLAVSVAQVYRILAKHFTLRSKWKKWTKRPPLPKATKPREVIQIDNVDLGELFCHNFIDCFTREVISVVVPEKDAPWATRALETAMDYFKTSTWIQTDNGSEYKAGFRRVARKYCQSLRQITPGQKDENAFIESFNRTLRKECVGWRKYQLHEIDQLQTYIDTYLVEYHEERPHFGLSLLTPKEFIHQYQQESHLT